MQQRDRLQSVSQDIFQSLANQRSFADTHRKSTNTIVQDAIDGALTDRQHLTSRSFLSSNILDFQRQHTQRQNITELDLNPNQSTQSQRLLPLAKRSASSALVNNRKKSIPKLFTAGCSKFEQCKIFETFVTCSDVRVQTQLSGEEDILSRSVANSALTSSRIQSRSFKKEKILDLNTQRTITNQSNEDGSPLKALELAKNAAIMKKQFQRRSQYFGKYQPVTTDPLAKLLETKKYIGTDTSQENFKKLPSSFSNELLSKSLESQIVLSTNRLQNKSRQVIEENLVSSTERAIYNQSEPKLLSITAESQLPQTNQNNSESQNKDFFVTKQIIPHDQEQSLSIPDDMYKYKLSVKNTIQRSLILEHCTEFNKEAPQYNSLLIHLGVLLQKARSVMQHQGLSSKPTYFLVSIASMVLDKLSTSVTSFDKILIPIKHILLQAIFIDYDPSRHEKEDSHLLDKLRQSTDQITPDKHRAELEAKYLRYDTYFDVLREHIKEYKQRDREKAKHKDIDEQAKKFNAIIANLVSSHQKNRERERMRRILHALRANSQQSQGLKTKIMDNVLIGNTTRNKNFMRKVFSTWHLFIKEQKIKQSKKEAEYYRDQIDEIDKQFSQVKASLKESATENQKLKEKLKEQTQKLESLQTQMDSYHLDTLSKKPLEVRQCLKLYFKYLFSNPLIARLKNERPTHLLAITQDQGTNNMRHLLQKSELIEYGGYGLQTLMNCGMKDIMLRWTNYMVDQAIIKLTSIIEVIQRHVDAVDGRARYQKVKRHESKDDSLDDMIEEESHDQSQSSDSEGQQFMVQREYMQLSQTKITPDNYIVFKNPKYDLGQLKQILSTMQKLVPEIGNNLIDHGILMAILFAIDQSERQIEVKLDKQAIKERLQQRESQLLKLQTSLFKDQTEEITIPDYKILIQYTLTESKEQRINSILLITELLTAQKLSWYFEVSDFLRGHDMTLVCYLQFLYFHHNCLNRPLLKIASSKQEQQLTEHQKSQEKKKNIQLNKKILHTIKTKIQPLLSKQKQAHFQDISLLYSSEELKGNKELSGLCDLPFMGVQDLLLRWANYMLRTYSQMKLQHDQEMEFKNKFKRGPLKLPSTITAQSANSPGRSNNNGQTSQNRFQIATKQMGVFTDAVETIEGENQKQTLEVKEIQQLTQQNYQRLILILLQMCPEALWELNQIDLIELKKLPTLIDVIEQFIEKGSPEQKYLVIVNAIHKITHSQESISLDDLYTSNVKSLEVILIDLFLARPSLSPNKPQSIFLQKLQIIQEFHNTQKEYLKGFDQQSYHMLSEHTAKMKEGSKEVVEAFAFVQDCDKIFKLVKDKFIAYKHEVGRQHHNRAVDLKIKRSVFVQSEIDRNITTIHKGTFNQLLPIRQGQQKHVWIGKLEEVLRKYLVPLKKLFHVHQNEIGLLAYSDMWRLLKSLNFQTFSVDSRDIELILMKILKCKSDEESGERNKSSSLTRKGTDNFGDVEYLRRNSTLTLLNRIGSKSQTRVSRKLSSGRDNEYTSAGLPVRAQVYTHKYLPSDLIQVFLVLIFKQCISNMIEELHLCSPSIFDDINKKINKSLPQEKIKSQIENYFIDTRPDVFFEQFLIHCVFTRSSFIKKHPFRFNHMRSDFRLLIDDYTVLLQSIFEFYMQEYSQQFPVQNKYKGIVLQIDAFVGMLREMNVFAESGLTKANMKKIINIILMQEKGEPREIQTKDRDFSPAGTLVKQMKQNQAENALYYGGSQESMIFFEFIEMLYLVAQHFNPDLFVNQNQKFADFLEKVLFVNLKLKLKNKKLLESPHKTQLMKALSNAKTLRGTTIGAYNQVIQLI